MSTEGLEQGSFGSRPSFADVTIPVEDVIKDLSVSVRLTGFRRFSIRLNVAKWIFRLGAWVSGMSCNIEVES